MRLFIIAIGFILMWLLLSAIADAQEPIWRVYALDIASEDAIAKCSNDGGLAGWLQRIAPNGDFIDPPAEPYCVVRLDK